jgi:DNA-binding NarL/FixJ family response regulator
MIKLFICDDHEMVRTALARALQSNAVFTVVAEASCASGLLELVRSAMEADVQLLDLNLNNAGLNAGIALIAKVCGARPPLGVLVVSMYDDPEVVRSALQAGASGYVTKDSAITVLEEALQHVPQGRKFLDPSLVESVIVKARREKYSPWDIALTKRERVLLALLVKGQRVSAIALSMGLSIKTISTHKMRLMGKLNVSNNADLVKLGVLHQND